MIGFERVQSDRLLMHKCAQSGDVEGVKALLTKYGYSSFINSVDDELNQVSSRAARK